MPHAGGRQECEHGEGSRSDGQGFEREREVGKVEELQRGWCGSRKSHRTSEGAWSSLDVKSSQIMEGFADLMRSLGLLKVCGKPL